MCVVNTLRGILPILRPMKAALLKYVLNCKRPNFGVVVIVAGFLLNITFGLCYSHGNISPYIISYTRLHSQDPSREEVTLGAVPWLNGGVLVSRAIFVPLGGWLSKKIGPRLTVILGSVIVVASLFLTAWTMQLSFWAAVVTYGVLLGLGEGLAHNPLLEVVMQWVPQSKGVLLGLLLARFGLSPVLFVPFQTFLINPHNLSPEYRPDTTVAYTYFVKDDVLDRVPYTFVYMGILILLIQVLTVFFIVEPRGVRVSRPVTALSLAEYLWKTLKPLPFAHCVKCGEWFVDSYLNNLADSIPRTDQSPTEENCEQETQFGSVDVEPTNNCVDKPISGNDSCSRNGNSLSGVQCQEAIPEDVSGDKDADQVSPLQLLKRWDFYLFWLAYVFMGIPNVYIVAEYKVFGQEFIFDDHALAMIGSVGSVLYFLGRLMWGFLTDPLDVKSVLVVVSGGVTALMFTLYSSSEGKVYFLWVCLLYFWLGGVVTVFPCCVAAWYGSHHFATNLGIAYSSQVVAVVIASVLPAFGHLQFGWLGEMLSIAVLGFVAVIFIIIAGDRKVKKGYVR